MGVTRVGVDCPGFHMLAPPPGVGVTRVGVDCPGFHMLAPPPGVGVTRMDPACPIGLKLKSSSCAVVVPIVAKKANVNKIALFFILIYPA